MELASAAMLPLEYGGDRDEFSVIFVSHDWEELVALLSSPSGFFESNQAFWPQAGAQVHPWTLLRPATVILRYAGKWPLDAIRMIGLARSGDTTAQSLRMAEVENLN